MKSISEFIRDNADQLAARVRERMRPLHDPATDPLHPSIQWLLRQPKKRQDHLITGVTKALHRQKDVIWGNSPGTGKTYCSIATAHCHANGKPYTSLVVCPPHLVEKWEREIKATIPGVVVIQLQDWKQWMMLSKATRSLVTAPTWFVTPISKAKLGAAWRPAFIKSKITGVLTCPDCSRAIYKKRHELADVEWLSKGKRFCEHCKSALWQECGEQKIAPSKVVKKWMKRSKFWDMVILDEAHQLKGNDTLAGESMHDFTSAASKCQLLTGTLIAGKADDLRPTYFRLLPSRFLKRGFEWNDNGAFSEKYGKIETTVIEKTGVNGKTSTRTTRKIRPGIMPNLFGDFVADRTVFLSLEDMGEDLPEYKELTVPMAMPMSLAAEYGKMAKVLIEKYQELCKSENPELGLKFLPTIAEALLTYPDDPSGWGDICYRDESKILVPVYTPRDFGGMLLPKEQAIVDAIEENLRQGRQSWVFSTRNATTERLLNILRVRFNTGHLTTAVPTSKREAWIAKEGPRVEVMVSHPKLVETGVELFGNGYNFSAIEWFATGYELNVVRQASARAWRLTQTQMCSTRYFYYENTAQEKVIKYMAKKLLAAEFIEGSLSAEGLMAEADEARIELAIIRELAESLTTAEAA